MHTQKIKHSIDEFLKDRKPDGRYSSFDYCFHYFQSFRKARKVKNLANPDNIFTSCERLFAYLASWGMLRGSSPMLQKSPLYFKKVIKCIADYDERIWEIDLDGYGDPKNRELLLHCKENIIKALDGYKSEILVTKIMMGVFGNVPALDTYFGKTLKVRSLNEKNLLKLHEFYRQNRSSLQKLVKVFNEAGHSSEIRYTKAKLLDMYGFAAGQK